MFDERARREIERVAASRGWPAASSTRSPKARRAGGRHPGRGGSRSARVEAVIVATEAETPELVLAYVESQRLVNQQMQAEMDKGGPQWTWGWRPGWMWLLALLWLYSLVLRPVVNAVFDASIEAVELPTLMTLTTAYLALYMGGHTAKDIFGGQK